MVSDEATQSQLSGAHAGVERVLEFIVLINFTTYFS